MAYKYHRNMTRHVLHPLRNMYRSGHLVVNAVADAEQATFFVDQAIPAGRCLHLDRVTGSGQTAGAKLGCTGNNKIPVWLFRDSDTPSLGLAGEDPTTTTNPTWNTGVSVGSLMFVGMPGFELATTEYDDEQVYLVGDALRAPEPVISPYDQTELRTVAGVVTNQSNDNGSATIVGRVSPGNYGESRLGSGFDEFGNKVLTFYTEYAPPIAGIVTGTPTNHTAGL